MNNNKIRFFTIKDGKIQSCATDAENMDQALEACDDIGADSVIAISEETADFIVSQF